ncbi:hypothetical protein DN752_04850 [Echinicola strongylocentroti]|uniref:Rhamnogalacturonase A/B/Epimerase-like pectate lyase domain-containing protein n=1 Tax=Echinicola strongylocentroti TaxID=1795355 RepID=A0A2Z4IEJ5_9BACT|nr:glycosyl hydrolase family 28-related protein [Echinicola strongylocentroti]AWW29511.1 hypothetical protein DN752_04850 [Echinicola strongylocentroti]
MNPKYLIVVLIALSACTLVEEKKIGEESLLWSRVIGDPGVAIDNSKLDADYPQMERWGSAGARNGIPFKDSLEMGITVNSMNSSGINAAIAQCPSGKYVFLPNGTYTIDGQVDLKKDVYLIGESREGVICNITMTSGNAFYFDGDDSNSGIYDLTIQGSWGEPQYDWNMGLGSGNTELPNNSNVSVKFKNAIDCFLDNVKIMNSAMHPVWVNATHITLRNLHIDGVHNKGGGAQGYFMVLNGDNLVTGCYMTHLRHFSIQGANAKYNVVYGNSFDQEVSFHTGDGGDNLIENNVINLPADMWENYYAIMGPWSIQHDLSEKPNFIYRNQCYHHNMSEGPLSPWSDSSVVYYGPHMVKPIGHNPILENFTPYQGGTPTGGTLYPIDIPSN